MTDRIVLSDEEQTAVEAAVRALPSEFSAADAIAAVPQLALLATHADAAKAFPIVVSTAERAELDRLRPLRETAPKKVSGLGIWLSVIAVVLAISGPALIMAGRTGSAAFDPVSGALPSGLCMIVATALLIWLEPRRTSNPLYHGGNFGAAMFVVFPILWAIGVFIVFGEIDEVLWSPAATVGLVLQILSIIGCLVLAVVAFRHDRERPQWSGGRKVRDSSGVPAEVAAMPEFRSGMEHRLDEWRRHVWRTSTAPERASVVAAELEVVRLLAERGALTPSEQSQAVHRIRVLAAWT
jgi:hypothetical protein